MVSHAGGISVATFIIAVALSMGYYQFVYIPQANAKPTLPQQVLQPPQTVQVKIAQGASLPTNPQFFVPKQASGSLGVSNKVVWTNTDVTGHSVTSDNGYVDIINGDFNSIKQQNTLIMPGKTFEFTFTKAGDYPYHCEPHPHMKGVVSIAEQKF